MKKYIILIVITTVLLAGSPFVNLKAIAGTLEFSFISRPVSLDNTGTGSLASITSFTFPGHEVAVTDLLDLPTKINDATGIITVIVPAGTNVKLLAPKIFTNYSKASIIPDSGVTRDFTNPVSYTVNADGYVKTYMVSVTAEKNTESKIISFFVPGQVATSTIDASTHTITVYLPYGGPQWMLYGNPGVDLTLSPTYTLSQGARATPPSGEAIDFNSGRISYIVTAEDGSGTAWYINIARPQYSYVNLNTTATWDQAKIKCSNVGGVVLPYNISTPGVNVNGVSWNSFTGFPFWSNTELSASTAGAFLNNYNAGPVAKSQSLSVICAIPNPAYVAGSCGPAATTYTTASAGYTGAFCSTGTVSPSSPAFPVAGGSTTWSCNGQNGGANTSCSATRSIVSYTLTTNTSTSGTVTKSPNKTTYSPNESVVVTAVPNAGYSFTSWFRSSVSGSANPQTLIMDSNKSMNASWATTILTVRVCNAFTYSSWSACLNNSQSRTITTSAPTDCTGGSPTLTQSCTTPLPPTIIKSEPVTNPPTTKPVTATAKPVVVYPVCSTTKDTCTVGSLGKTGTTGENPNRWFWACVGKNTGWPDGTDTAWCFAPKVVTQSANDTQNYAAALTGWDAFIRFLQLLR